jgi:hypothetical protein
VRTGTKRGRPLAARIVETLVAVAGLSGAHCGYRCILPGGVARRYMPPVCALLAPGRAGASTPTLQTRFSSGSQVFIHPPEHGTLAAFCCNFPSASGFVPVAAVGVRRHRHDRRQRV